LHCALRLRFTRTNTESGSNIHLDKNDLDVLGVESVQVANGEKLAQLGVFHELHCLVRNIQVTVSSLGAKT
jgi:hypothetical protein